MSVPYDMFSATVTWRPRFWSRRVTVECTRSEGAIARADAKRLALELGWTPPKWWEVWRRHDTLTPTLAAVVVFSLRKPDSEEAGMDSVYVRSYLPGGRIQAILSPKQYLALQN